MLRFRLVNFELQALSGIVNDTGDAAVKRDSAARCMLHLMESKIFLNEGPSRAKHAEATRGAHLKFGCDANAVLGTEDGALKFNKNPKRSRRWHRVKGKCSDGCGSTAGLGRLNILHRVFNVHVRASVRFQCDLRVRGDGHKCSAPKAPGAVPGGGAKKMTLPTTVE